MLAAPSFVGVGFVPGLILDRGHGQEPGLNQDAGRRHLGMDLEGMDLKIARDAVGLHSLARVTAYRQRGPEGVKPALDQLYAV